LFAAHSTWLIAHSAIFFFTFNELRIIIAVNMNSLIRLKTLVTIAAFVLFTIFFVEISLMKAHPNDNLFLSRTISRNPYFEPNNSVFRRIMHNVRTFIRNSDKNTALRYKYYIEHNKSAFYKYNDAVLFDCVSFYLEKYVKSPPLNSFPLHSL